MSALKWTRGNKLEREIKKKNNWDQFSCNSKHENFIAAMRIWEMLAATMQGENERQWKSKVNRDTYYKNIFSIEPVTREFLEVSHFARAKQRLGNVQKMCWTCKVVIINRCIHRFFSITQFHIFDIKESFAFSPGSEKYVKSTKQNFNVIGWQ